MNYENDEDETILSVKDIMTKDVIIATENCSVTEIAQLIVQHRIGSVLIGKEDQEKFPELVTKTDILRLIGRGEDPSQVKIGTISSGPVVTCHLSTSVEKAMRIMRKQTIKRLVVIDKNREIKGVVSSSDIIRAAPGLVEVIKSKSRLECNDTQNYFTGYCDQCGNYSTELLDLGGYTVCAHCKDLYYRDFNDDEPIEEEY